MIGKPFRTPVLVRKTDGVLLRKTDDSEDNEGVSEPKTKRRRISDGKGDSEKTMGPQLVFKIPGISSVPRKPLSAVKNLAITMKPLDGEFEGYYNVLWYVYLS